MERERESILEAKRAAFDVQLTALSECLASAKEWATVQHELHDVRANFTVVESFGSVLSQKMMRVRGMTPAKFVEQMSVDENGKIGKEEFFKFTLKFKNASELRIEGTHLEVLSKIGHGFDMLVKRVTGRASPIDQEVSPAVESDDETRDGDGEKIEAMLAVETMIREGSWVVKREAELSKINQDAMERATSIQTAYVETAARKQGEFRCLLQERKTRIPADFYAEMAQW